MYINNNKEINYIKETKTQLNISKIKFAIPNCKATHVTLYFIQMWQPSLNEEQNISHTRIKHSRIVLSSYSWKYEKYCVLKGL